MDATDYDRFGRALAALEAEGLIEAKHALGKRYAAGIRITDPSFILYMAAHHEDLGMMDKLCRTVDGCRRGQSTRAQAVMSETRLPYSVVFSMFKVFEAKGFGTCSNEIGYTQSYVGRA